MTLKLPRLIPRQTTEQQNTFNTLTGHLRSQGFTFFASKSTDPIETPIPDPDDLSTEKFIEMAIKTAVSNNQEYQILWYGTTVSIWIRDPSDKPQPITTIAQTIIKLIDKL